MKALYIIDDSNFRYKFKAIHSAHSSVDFNGVKVNTSVLFGYVRALKNCPFNDILIVLDGIPQQSLNLLPNYKGTRNHESDEGLSVSRVEVTQALTKLGELLNKNIKVVCSPLQETDQVISSVVHYITKHLPPRWQMSNRLHTHLPSEDRILKRYSDACTNPLDPAYLDQFDSAVIASTDGDFIQLLRFDNVYIDTSTSGKLPSRDRVTDSTAGLPPAATIIYKAIFGDTSDNVPAIGIKNASAVELAISNITSEETLRVFVDYVRGIPNSSQLPLSLKKLANEIHCHYLKEFERNLGVTYLTFMSLPTVLTFPDYDLNKTLTKYKVTV